MFGTVLLCFIFNNYITALLVMPVVDSICDEICLAFLDPTIKGRSLIQLSNMSRPKRHDLDVFLGHPFRNYGDTNFPARLTVKILKQNAMPSSVDRACRLSPTA